MKKLKYVKIIIKNKQNYLIEVYTDNTIKKILIKDEYKDILVLTLAMIFQDL